MNPPVPTPPGALGQLSQIQTANKALLSALESHQAFPAQRHARSGKVHFMHDFASRTDAMFESILNDAPAPDTPVTKNSTPQTRPSAMTAAQRDELKSDTVGRCMMLHSMITDTTGMTAMMFGEQPGTGVDLGDAVKRASDALVAVVES